MLKEKELTSQTVKSNKQKLKSLTGFINAELFDMCLNFITHGQLIEENSFKLPLSEQYMLVMIRL